MSTRSIFTFKGDGESHHVYMHHDGYPSGAAEALMAVINQGTSWGVQRFEADEFAAGFVAANKQTGGGIRLARSRRAAADVEYGYTITSKKGVIHVTAASIEGWDAWKETPIFSGELQAFYDFATADED